MDGGIYLLGDDEEGLTRITEQPYDSENLLQRFLADHPDLLAGEQIDEDDPRRWYLLLREAGVPDEEEKPDRWSMDHLFVDQDAIPTIVEVKRSSDTRVRREVVGQMLEYAANATAYWDINSLQARVEEAQRRRDRPAGESGPKSITPPGYQDLEEFWDDVETNLEAGNIRMLFVADDIPTELKRIVEFLNEHLENPEVLAVEIKQYTGEGQRALVPRVYGKTARAEKSSSSARGSWDEESFLEAAREELSGEHFEAVRDLYRRSQDLIETHGGEMSWGTGTRTGSCNPIISPLDSDDLDLKTSLFTLRTDGSFECKFWHPEEDEKRLGIERFRQELFDIPGMEEAHEEHCGGHQGIPPEKWVPRSRRIQEIIEGFFEAANR